MMNPILLSFADGTTFFVGLGLVLVSEALLLRFKNRLTRPILTVIAVAGIILVVISATPLPKWLYSIWTIPAVAGLVLLNRTACARRLCVICGVILAASTLALGFAEAPFHRRPTVQVPAGTSVYVLGDSISAGIGTKLRCWPEILGKLTLLPVVNLAQPGATVESALAQAQGIAEAPSLVIVEIGGNDLLGGTDAGEFRAKLDTLVSSLRSSQHAVLLFELPLFPFQNAIGQAQRQVAAQHGAALLPKRCFARVLGTANGTLDGLHLSQAGHDAMARIIADAIEVK